ncbi:hypothetical protein BV22DRAFT_342671 [Leucogyrophana mollusca]|uniref:Uncharacterized protein n=1 Tax=Leucogyrophana mollusca TaxID=85980 RepID=A0ACB8BLV4_9AGAM|nr:hypothetical protein BV22DRAFT_342671 [Leucogyrophana mollusca]
MQLLFTTLAFFAGSTLTAAASIKETCGDSKILNTTVIPVGDQQITITDVYCPGFAALTAHEPKRAYPLGKKDIQQCSESCSESCFIGGTAANWPACQTLSASLTELGAQQFVMTGGTARTFSIGGACQFTFANQDGYTYDVCYDSFSNVGYVLANYCLQGMAAAGGYCTSSSQGSYWQVEVNY